MIKNMINSENTIKTLSRVQSGEYFTVLIHCQDMVDELLSQ